MGAVIRELRVAASLIFLAHRDLPAPWCSEVSLFDASSCSGAVVVALIPAAVMKAKAAATIAEHISDQLNRTSAIVVTVIAAGPTTTRA